MARWLIVLALVAGSLPVAASADPVAERREEMKEFRDDMKAMRAALERPTARALAELRQLAADMVEDAFEIKDWFAKKTISARSAALPSIWERPDEFAARIESLSALAAKLAEAATSGDVAAARLAFETLGREGCTGCHAAFRRKQD